jgi:sterol-4alpha-carboxylate 3-dehydrogenase (decarboxylating)
MAEQRTFLVIGGAGFLGSHLVQELISQGKRSVAVYDLNEPSSDEIIDGVKYYTGDILDLDKLVDVMKTASPQTSTFSFLLCLLFFG